MSKETRYSVTFDFIESCLLRLNESVEWVEEEMGYHERKEFHKAGSTLYLLRRINRINEKIKALNIIYRDVNTETREMMELLYIKGLGFEETSKRTGIKEKRLLFRHNLIVEEMMILLGEVSENESRKRVNHRRTIPENVRKEVFKRDNGRCVECEEENNLHYHHIKRYANGGKDTVDNLTLLCVDCHAEEHKEEPAYHMLKAMAKG